MANTTETSEMASAELKSLEEQLFTDTEAWMAAPGEVLVGLVVNIDRRTSAYGPYPSVTVRKEDGEELVFHAFRTVAKSELSRCRPVIGDQIGILYEGQVKGGDYHGYRIRLNRVASGQAIDWAEWDNDRKPLAPGQHPDEAV